MPEKKEYFEEIRGRQQVYNKRIFVAHFSADWPDSTKILHMAPKL